MKVAAGPVLAVLGPTAGGKSAVAMALATGDVGRRLGIELVSIDAMQVYRGMDIGTAKPDARDRAGVRHHLIDLVEASESFTVTRFQSAYREAVADIVVRGARPLLVGGTGLYLRAVVDDLDIPGQWPEVRRRLEQEAETSGPEALHRRLVAIDPAAAAKMEPSNTRRIIRALEVCEGGGRPFSSYGPGVDNYPVSTVTQVALRWNREVLARRIRARVVDMLDAGLVAEVERLRSTGLSRTAAQALGYKEVIAHLDGEMSLDQTVETVVLRTRQFAVRQERWFRRDPRIRWFDVESDPVAEVAPVLERLLT